MRDLKHIHFFEQLLEQADNELVRQEREAGGVAVGYTCYYLPEALLNCGKAFSVRLRAPHTGASAWLYRIFEHQAVCGEPRALENDRKVNAILRRQVAAGKCPKTIRHRAVIWNTPANNYANFNNWLLECWGIDSVCEMIDLHGTGLIDTSSRESMLRGIADMVQTSTMRAHTKGGSELMLDDLWEKYAQYNADMIIMFDQISCKGVGAINGLFEEGARQRGIRMCKVRQDLMDPTSITRREMRNDVNIFMQTVMNETPLDPSLVDFDDDESW